MAEVTDEDLQSVLDNDAVSVAALLEDLSPTHVLRLQEMEAQGKARPEVVDAINHFIDRQQQASEETAPAPARTRAPKKTAKQERGEEVPEHLKPDYSGPLTIDLMEKRAAHFAAQTK